MRYHHQRQGGPSNGHGHQEVEHVCKVMAGKCVPGSHGLVPGDSENGHPKVGGKGQGSIQALLGLWTDSTHLAAVINGGCEPNVTAWQNHAADLDATGADVLKSFIAISTNEVVRSPYMHALACHFR